MIREKIMGNSNMPQPGNSQGGTPSTAGSKQSTAESAENFVLVDSEQGLDIGDDLFSIGEVRRADRLPHHQSGSAGRAGRAPTMRPTPRAARAFDLLAFA
jgi:hypothetical protein